MEMTLFCFLHGRFLVVAVGELNKIKQIRADWWNNKQIGYMKSGMNENSQTKLWAYHITTTSVIFIKTNKCSILQFIKDI